MIRKQEMVLRVKGNRRTPVYPLEGQIPNRPDRPIFVRTDFGRMAQILSERDLGLRVKILNFCPNQDLALKGTIRGPLVPCVYTFSEFS